jgi:hypothetical protein
MKSDRATVLIIQPGPFTHRYRKQIFKSATNAGYATIYGIATAADTNKSKHHKPKVFARQRDNYGSRQRDNYGYWNARGYAQRGFFFR